MRFPRIGDVYEAFKRYARKPGVMDSGMEALIADIRTYADYFCAMALDSEKDKILKMAFQDLRELKVDAAWPFLLVLYHDYNKEFFLPRIFKCHAFN